MGKCSFVPAGVMEWVASVPTAPIPPFWVIAVLCAAYLVFVLGGARVMRNRAALKLRVPLAVHNGILFVYSLLSTLAMGFVVLCNTPYRSFDEMVCDGENALFEGFNSWVLFFFLLSKMWEFLDTAFLVLGKHRLRFLHVYHHVVTLPLSWVLYKDASANGTICAWTNMLVHTPMYYYYTVSALGGTVWWKKYITQMQIAQFVFCIGIMVYDLVLLRPATSVRCTVHKPYPYRSILCSAVIYATFLALFIQLYVSIYKARKTSKPAAASDVPKPKKTN